MKIKKKCIFAIIVMVIITVIIVLLLRSCHYNNSLQTDVTSTTESKELDFIPYGNNETITIPGIDGLSLKAGQLQQQVDFYNPSRNKCYFKMSLYLSDDTKVWQSDYLAPSESISEIMLNQRLERGLYKNCRLVYECFSLTDKSPLNSGTVKLEINSY